MQTSNGGKGGVMFSSTGTGDGKKIEQDNLPVLSEGDVDVSGSETNGVWLVKIPEFLAKEWKTRKPDENLGKISIEDMGPNREPKLTLHLGDKPEYSISFRSDPPPLYVFSHNQSGKIALEAFVGKSCSLTPSVNLRYENVLKERTEASNKRTRFTRLSDTKEVESINRTMTQQRSRAIFSAAKFQKKTEKFARKSVPELEAELFKLFSEKKHWSLKDLRAKTEQPTVYLREVLDGVADYNRNGPNKNTFQLKPEFASKTSETASSSKPSASTSGHPMEEDEEDWE